MSSSKSSTYWHTHITPLFEPLIASLVINAPSNPKAWIINKLSGKDSDKVSLDPPPPRPPSPDGKVHPNNDNVLYSKEAFKVDPITGEKIEADTDDQEDAVSLEKILLPGEGFPTDISKFSISYNQILLSSWVKQPSPCCGAASVAGAINCIRGIKRGEDGVIGHLDVLPIMGGLLEDQMKTIKRKLERILGAVDPLINAVKAELLKDGRTLGGKEKNGAKQGAPKSLLLKVIRKVVEEAIKSRSSKKEPEVKNSNGEENGEVKEEELLTSTIEMGDCFERIHKFYVEADNKKKSKEEEAIEEESEVDEDDRDDEEDNLENKKESPNANDEELLVFDFSKPIKKRKSSTTPSWKSLLLEVLKKLGGLEKVYHTLKPSTGPFGNWGIIGACKGLNISSQDYVFDCTVVMGKKSSKQKKGYVSLHGSDTEEDIEEQWSKLRSLFLNDLSVLLSHHKNHYALIYALREYKKEGKWVRQVFTARKGQRPSCWIDFEELRKTYLGWEGYKLMVVTGKKL